MWLAGCLAGPGLAWACLALLCLSRKLGTDCGDIKKVSTHAAESLFTLEGQITIEEGSE